MDEFTCSTSADELDEVRHRLRTSLDAADVHPDISRDVIMGFSELTTPRGKAGSPNGDQPGAGDRPDGKVSVGLSIDADEVSLRVHSSVPLTASAREAGEQDLMLHVLVDRVDRAVDDDGSSAITITKRRIGR